MSKQIKLQKTQSANIIKLGEQKQTQDVIRLLKQQLDAYKDENQDIKEELNELTQSYLKMKEKCSEYVIKIENLNKQLTSQDRIVVQKVQKGINQSFSDLQEKLEKQEQMIQKLRMQKTCLCKNVQELQERLKATRHELFLTQKQLYASQAKTQTKNTVESPGLASISKGANLIQYTPGRGNKVMAYQDFSDILDQETPDIPSNKENLSLNSKQESRTDFKKRSGATKKGLTVAKSLAVARSTLTTGLGLADKYTWLFNEDETPRSEIEVEVRDIENERKTTGNKYQNHEDQLTQANSNSNHLSGPFKHAQNLQNFSETIESARENAQDGLLGRPSLMKLDQAQTRESIVAKSLHSLKSIFLKAKEGEFAGQSSRPSQAHLPGSGSKVICHETVELDLVNDSSVQICQNPLADDSI